MHWSPRVASLTLVQLLFYLKAGSPVSVSHSLRHYLMATPTGSGLPRFLEVGLLDGMPFFRYDSNVGRAVALSPWFSDFVIGREGDQLNWDMQTAQQILTRGLGEAMHRFNHTGIHVFQGTLGCELLSNGLPRPFLSYSYDGSDFISYEPSTRTWTPAQPQAFVYKQLREADLDYQPVLDSYYGAVCVAHLREFLDHAGDVLKETAKPEVTLIEKRSHLSSVPEVTCHVTGFYPPEVMVEWLEAGGSPLVEGVTSGEVLPNGDGTYQFRKTLKMSSGAKDTQSYSCLVLHSSIPTNITVTWAPKRNGTDWIIVGVAVVAVAAILTAIAVVAWKEVLVPATVYLALTSTIWWTGSVEADRSGDTGEEEDGHSQEGKSARCAFLRE
ncbi:major histocompatibility complex class I-related gene protein-like isoform X1 [Megalops cyprinoides]|uniref:major histocompatibility complex class I-related gene protein-like isoform X1 n=1 Tax=Megalops cyprinoides TaxID=118141 RepID=UPI001863AFBC|nr:major histocompatibility complex class I-related gene protein-like isoform X1 [Megalops cyprinoides]